LHWYRRATLEQIGVDIGVTWERVRQIQLDALKNLRCRPKTAVRIWSDAYNLGKRK